MDNYITEKEIWKDVAGYEDYYEVSNTGRLKRKSKYITGKNGVTRFWKGRELRFHVNADGYHRCILSMKGKVKHDSIHRLVAEAFIKNPNNLPVINHKDEDPSNNHVENLEWCTIAYNNAYGTRTERMMNNKHFKERHAENRMPVLKFSLKGELLERFESLEEAFNSDSEFTKSGVNHCCTGRLNTYKGFIWKYEEDYTEEKLKKRTSNIRITKSIRVDQLDLNGKFIKTYNTMGQASRATGVRDSGISACCSGKAKTAGGYKWEYAN